MFAFSQRLKSARLQHGLTQAQLGSSLGVSKQAISQYERGKKKPTSQTLLSIAHFFGKPPGFFLRPIRTALEDVSFRKMATLQGRQLEMVKAEVLDRLEPYLELESILGFKSTLENPLADHVIKHVDHAEDAANSLLEAWDLGTNPIPNVLEMLEDKEVKVVGVNVNDHFDGLSTWVDGTIPVIVINHNLDTVRKRFTALHELGHLLLNFSDSLGKKECEKACNRFAGALLLPARVLYSELGRRRTAVSFTELIALKEYYGVSLAAIVYRCGELGIFPRALVNRFWKLRNRDKHVRLEIDLGEYQGEEKAFRFDRLLSKAIAEDIITLSKASELSGIPLTKLREQYRQV